MPHVPPSPGVVRPDEVSAAVAETWGVPFATLAGPVRTRYVSRARAALCRELRARTPMSLAEIGAYLGGRDHTTILSLLRGARGLRLP